MVDDITFHKRKALGSLLLLPMSDINESEHALLEKRKGPWACEWRFHPRYCSGNLVGRTPDLGDMGYIVAQRNNRRELREGERVKKLFQPLQRLNYAPTAP